MCSFFTLALCFWICFIITDASLIDLTDQSNHLIEHEQGTDAEQNCIPGHAYKQDCNTCKCSNNGRLLCTRMACLSPEAMDKLMDNMPQHNEIDSKDKAPEHMLRQKLVPKKAALNKKCVYGKSYKVDCNVCFCSREQNLICSMRDCDPTEKTKTRSGDTEVSPNELIPLLDDHDFLRMASLPHLGAKCVPGKIYRVQCNTCLCRDTGVMFCTDMLCKNSLVDGVSAALRQTGSPCKEQEDFVSECLKCNCQNATWQCDAIPHCDPPSLRMTPKKYQRECKSKIQCDMALDPEVEKCQPGESYLQDCNRCRCMPDFSLRCTLKMCLNYREAQLLNKQRIMLLNNKE